MSDFATFKKRLQAGEFKDATGARKSCGKLGFDEATKAKGRKLIDEYFGEEGAAKAEKPAPEKKKAAGAKKVSKSAPAEKAEEKPSSKKEAPAAKAKGAKKTAGKSGRVAKSPVDSAVAAVKEVKEAQKADAPKTASEIVTEIDTLSTVVERMTASAVAAHGVAPSEEVEALIKKSMELGLDVGNKARAYLDAQIPKKVAAKLEKPSAPMEVPAPTVVSAPAVDSAPAQVFVPNSSPAPLPGGSGPFIPPGLPGH